VEKCEGDNIRMRKYLDDGVLKKIYEENGVPIPTNHAENDTNGSDDPIEYSHAMRRRLSNGGVDDD